MYIFLGIKIQSIAVLKLHVRDIKDRLTTISNIRVYISTLEICFKVNIN